MSSVDLRELECVLVLSEELHFGRTAERLRVSQGRVSQLVSTLERRIGGRLFERTSRRVRLTELGLRFLADVRPAYDDLHGAVRTAQSAARGVRGLLRLGFIGVFDELVTGMVATFEESYPGCEVMLCESPLNDPFGGVRSGAVDAAVVFGAVDEPDLVIGASFSEQPQAVVMSARHPLARRGSLSVEELADLPMIEYSGVAPGYWRESVAPTVTPDGRMIPRGPRVSTLQEGVTMIAAKRGVMIFCLPTALGMRRNDVTAVPIEDLPSASRSLIWRQGGETDLLRAFAGIVAGTEQTALPARRGPGTLALAARGHSDVWART